MIESRIDAICHSRRNFYEGRPIYWYELKLNDDVAPDSAVPTGFIRVPYTVYFEFGGDFNEAVHSLEINGWKIFMGDDV